MYWPLTGICEVPVLPPSSFSKPATLASWPDPFWTTDFIISFIWAAVAAETTCCGAASERAVGRPPTRSTTCGWIHLPPLGTTFSAAIIWTMFTSMPCPKEVVASSESR